MRLETFGQTFQDFEPKLDKAAYLEFASTPAARPLLQLLPRKSNPDMGIGEPSRRRPHHKFGVGQLLPSSQNRIASASPEGKGTGCSPAQTAIPNLHNHGSRGGPPAGRPDGALPTRGSSCSFHQQRAGTGTQGSATRSRHTGPRFLEPGADASVSSHSGTVSCTNHGGLEAIPIRRAGGVGACRHCRIVRR
jgi:hypothetical protein